MVNFYFIPDKLLEKIVEKYIRKGPSPRYKVSVTPIKILTRCKGGKPCYRTYYVGTKKFEKYRNIAKQQFQQGYENPKYIVYWDEAKPRFRQFKIRGWQRKYLGDSFTKDLVHLSGFVWSHSNRLARFGVSSYSEIVFSYFDTRTGTHFVELKDGSTYKTQLLLGKDGKFRLRTEGTILTIHGENKFNAEINGKIKFVRDSDGITRRVLQIDDIKGYDAESLSGFMDFAQHKFARIEANIQRLSERDVGRLLLNGFGENVRVGNSIKREILDELEKIGVSDRIKKWVSNATNIQDIVNALVKGGILSENHPLIQKLVVYVRQNSNGNLIFNSVRNGVYNTKSQNTLHAFQLQMSADNDYHKGFRRYRKLIGS